MTISRKEAGNLTVRMLQTNRLHFQQGSRTMNEIICRLAKLYEKMKKCYENGEISSIYDIEEIETIRVVLETIYMREANNGIFTRQRFA